ncbi:MAG TPA: TetR/AcrR family transcriptional regulator [Propionibacteriaceae bacterium]|jgi:AcrR family transcriptional regulator
MDTSEFLSLRSPRDLPSDRRLTTRQAALRSELVALVLHEGFAHLRVEDLAARLGCSRRTLYALAPSREQLATLAVREFFRTATAQVEGALLATSDAPDRDGEPDAADRVTRYLSAVAEALAPASRAFLDDVAHFAPAREIYENNTAAAARRVRSLLDEGTRTGAFRPVRGEFVAEVVTATMRRIASGDVQSSTGLTDADAYAELAGLVVAAVRR